MSEFKLSDIWDDATNAVCQAMQESKICKCKDGECIAAKIEPSAETVLHWNTRAAPDVPELVAVSYEVFYAPTREWRKTIEPEYYRKNGDLVRDLIDKSKAAEIIAAKDAEFVSKLKEKVHQDRKVLEEVSIDRWNWKERAEAAEAKLAQYEAQEPVGCATVYIYKGRRNLVMNELGNNAAGTLPIGEHKLYASPVPAADLKAEASHD